MFATISLPAATWLRRSVAVAASGLLVAACAGSGSLGAVATPPPSTVPSIAAPTAEATPGSTTPATSPVTSPTASPGATTTVRAYFFLGSFTSNAGLAPVLREVPHTVAVGKAALNQLIAGPNAQELGARPAMYTDLPDGTRLLDLAIDGGVATVDLSSEFASGGTAPAVVGRYAQVVYTLTQFPTVTSVRFELDGVAAPASVSGGTLSRAVTRADYSDQLPAILVDRPAWGAALGNPARVTGVANVFEATFRIRISDASSRELADVQVMATCGTGCWGSFDATIPYTVSSAQWGMLRVYDVSMKDGLPEKVTEYPVWLTP